MLERSLHLFEHIGLAALVPWIEAAAMLAGMVVWAAGRSFPKGIGWRGGGPTMQ